MRELENTIERAVVLATGPVIDAAAMLDRRAAGGPRGPGPAVRRGSTTTSSGPSASRCARALRQAQGVKKDAAELLGISQRALSYYLGKYKID